ncbi:Unknown protein, partial [Striga hermonthica]
PGTMSGMISLCDVPIFALFDTGATHSFVSAKCLEAIGVRGVSAIDPLEISLASGRKIVTSSLAEDLSMSIGGRTLEVDAFVIEMRDFDLILGMDCLRSRPTPTRLPAKSLHKLRPNPLSSSRSRLATVHVRPAAILIYFQQLSSSRSGPI